MKMADQLGQNNYYLIDKELDIDKLEDQKSKLAARLKRDEQRRLKRLEKDKERQVNDLKARMVMRDHPINAYLSCVAMLEYTQLEEMSCDESI